MPGDDARTVVVVDDHRTVTELLTMALDAHPGLDCLGSAHDAASAVVLLERHRVDVVVMDYRLGRDDGVELTRRITDRWPGVAVVLLTAYPTRPLMSAAATAGASAMLPKDGSLSDLLEVIGSAAPGRFVVPPALLRMLVTEDQHHPGTALTPRELEVLRLLSLGHDVRRIARELGITVNTARGHVKSILSKLDAHSQLDAVARAHRTGLIGSGGGPR